MATLPTPGVTEDWGDDLNAYIQTLGGVTDWTYQPVEQRQLQALRDTRTGTWTFTYDSGQLGLGFCYNSSNAQNDSLSMWVWLGEGTYTLAAVGQQDTNRAIVTWAIDDGAGNFTNVGTSDWYGTNTLEVLKTVTGITVSGPCVRRRLRATVATRNPSSVGWYMSFNQISLIRTA